MRAMLVVAMLLVCRRMASGVYFVRMQAAGVDQIKRTVLVK